MSMRTLMMLVPIGKCKQRACVAPVFDRRTCMIFVLREGATTFSRWLSCSSMNASTRNSSFLGICGVCDCMSICLQAQHCVISTPKMCLQEKAYLNDQFKSKQAQKVHATPPKIKQPLCLLQHSFLASLQRCQ